VKWIVAFVAALVFLSSAAAGTISDQGVARSLVVHAADARPLFPRDMEALPNTINPCPMYGQSLYHNESITSGVHVSVSASAGGNWGGVQIGLFSTATVASTRDGASRLYEVLSAKLPGCLLRTAQRFNDHRKSHHCRSAWELPLAYQIGDATGAWRAEYFTRYANGCTARSLDGVVVRVGRAIALYLFDNARQNPSGRDLFGIAARVTSRAAPALTCALASTSPSAR
jgi:hypothetical protein